VTIAEDGNAAVIRIERIDDETFRVTVTGRVTTQHEVSLSPSYCDELTGGRVSPEILIERSFEFLLERESNRSILSRFDLAVIGRYFPEYETAIRERLA
jgi:hypothetical protein